MEDAALDELLAFLAQDAAEWTTETPEVLSVEVESSLWVEERAEGGEKPKARRSRKQELAELREEGTQLAASLERLKKAAGVDWIAPVARTKSSRASAGADLSLWRKLAARQVELRREAEQENKALKAMLAALVRRGKRLRVMAQKRAMNESRQLMPLIHHPDAIFPHSLPDDQLVWRQLSVGMDNMFATIDVAFAQAEMHHVPRPGRTARVRTLGHSAGAQPVLCQVHVVPFELSLVERAVWQHFARDPANMGYEAANSFQFSYKHPAVGVFVMQQRSVTRRYREHNRSVIINHSITEPIPGIATQSTLQVVIKEGEPSVCGPTTVIEVLMYSSTKTPEAEKQVCNILCKQHGVTMQELNLGLAPWERALDTMMSSIENSLVSTAVPISSV